MSQPILMQLTNITKEYHLTADVPVTRVLAGISLTIAAGQRLAITGPSGSGKSTLLAIMGGLERPTTGQVLFSGQDIVAWDEQRRAMFRNREIGFVFQAHHLLAQCTVLENVLVPTLAFPGKQKPAQYRGIALELLEYVGMSRRLRHRPAELSGGEQLRVAVVRALINQPRLLLADEPTGSLDRASARELAELLLRLNRDKGLTLVLVTHSGEIADLMQQRYELSDGIVSRVR